MALFQPAEATSKGEEALRYCMVDSTHFTPFCYFIKSHFSLHRS